MSRGKYNFSLTYDNEVRETFTSGRYKSVRIRTIPREFRYSWKFNNIVKKGKYHIIELPEDGLRHWTATNLDSGVVLAESWHKEWWEGERYYKVFHREDGPAEIVRNVDGDIICERWFRNGNFYSNGLVEYEMELDGKRHELYHLNGKEHRIDDPEEDKLMARYYDAEDSLIVDGVHMPKFKNYAAQGISGLCKYIKEFNNLGNLVVIYAQLKGYRQQEIDAIDAANLFIGRDPVHSVSQKFSSRH